MIKTTLYLDTSVINFLFAEDAPEKQEITIDFFDNFLKKGIYEAFISRFVIDEIEKTNEEEKRNKLLQTIKDYPIQLIDIQGKQAEIQELALKYLEKGIIPPKKLLDALHVGVAVIFEIEFLVSWNYKHLANINRESKIRSINLEQNYLKNFRIITPSELIDYEE